MHTCTNTDVVRSNATVKPVLYSHSFGQPPVTTASFQSEPLNKSPVVHHA